MKNGRLVCTAVAGKANIKENRPVTPDTLFLIASVSKTVTGTRERPWMSSMMRSYK